MELFCLGPNDPTATTNYSQADIVGLTRALTGWRYNGTATTRRRRTPNSDYDAHQVRTEPVRVARRRSSDDDRRGHRPTNTTTNPADLDWGPNAVNQAIDIVLAHAQHAQFLIRKLWGEFIASPIPQATLDTLGAEYRAATTSSSR